MNSQRHLDGSMSHHSGKMSQGLHGQLSQGNATDNASRVFSADHLDGTGQPPVMKTIMSYLNEKVTNFIMNEKDPSLAQLKIEGDMVTSFFDAVDKMSDQSLYTFIEDMKKDIEVIMQILYNSTNEMIVFFTYLLLILKKLNPIDHSFTNAMHMCKNLAKEINEDVTNGGNPSSVS